jgi:lysophospholipase L1-like esterase
MKRRLFMLATLVAFQAWAAAPVKLPINQENHFYWIRSLSDPVPGTAAVALLNHDLPAAPQGRWDVVVDVPVGSKLLGGAAERVDGKTVTTFDKLVLPDGTQLAVEPFALVDLKEGDHASGPSVNVIGDSLMVGVAQCLPEATNLSIVANNARGGTHLFHWLKAYPRTDATILLIGTNDCVWKDFGTPRFERDYRAKLQRLLAGIHSDRIIWVGIPSMTHPRFTEHAKVVNAWERSVAATDRRVVWINPDRYLDNQPGVRTADGVHCTPKGYALLAKAIGNHL